MNGDKVGQDAVNARDLTREIERETNLTVEAQDMRERGAMSDEQAINLGNKVLAYNPERVAHMEGEMTYNAERVREMVEAESGLTGEAVDEGLADAENALLVAEREAWNQENLLNEVDPRRDHEAKIMAHDQRGIAEDIASRVESVMRGGDFRIMDLVLLQSKGRDSTLEAYENPRRLGDMN